MITGLNSAGVDVADLRVLPVGGQPPPDEDARLRRRLPRRRQPDRPRDDPDPVLRAARDPADDGAREGGREALHPPRAAPRAVRRHRQRHLPGARARELRAGPALRRSTSTRSARAASGSSSTTATRRRRSSCRCCSARSGSRRSRRTGSRPTRRATAASLRESIGQAKRLVGAIGADLGAVFDRAGERLFLVDEQGREIAVEQTLLLFLRLLGAGGEGRQGRVPVTVTSRVEELAAEARARGRAHAGGAGRAARGGDRRTASSSRARSAALRLPGVPARPTTRSRASASCSSCWRRSTRPLSELVAELPALDRRPPAARLPVGAEGARHARAHRAAEGPRARPDRRDQGDRRARLGGGAPGPRRAARPHLRGGRRPRRLSAELEAELQALVEEAMQGQESAAPGANLKLRLNLWRPPASMGVRSPLRQKGCRWKRFRTSLASPTPS